MKCLDLEKILSQESWCREMPNSVLHITLPFCSMRGKGSCFRHGWKCLHSTWLYFLIQLSVSYNKNLNLCSAKSRLLPVALNFLGCTKKNYDYVVYFRFRNEPWVNRTLVTSSVFIPSHWQFISSR